MKGNDKCSHCGKRIGFGEFRFPDVHVSVKSADLDYRYDADVLCADCFEKLNDRIGRMIRGGARMSESLYGPWNLYVEQQTTITKETNYLCRSTGKPCVNATDLGYCKLTACSNSEAWNRRAET